MEPDIQPNSSATPGSSQPVKTRPSDGEISAGSTPSTNSGQASSPQATTSVPVAQTVTTVLTPTPTPVVNVPETKNVTPIMPTTPVEAVPDPVVASPGSTSSPQAVKEPTIAEKLEAARVAMEGPERAGQRQQREKSEKVKSESAELEAQKDKIEKAKEKLELDWIDWDNKRTTLKKSLEPILAEETAAEDEQKKIELEEEQAALPEQKQEVEKRRQAVADKRKEVEGRKWVIQDKIKKIELEIEKNTQKYQPLLDEEEKIITKIDQLKSELI